MRFLYLLIVMLKTTGKIFEYFLDKNICTFWTEKYLDMLVDGIFAYRSVSLSVHSDSDIPHPHLMSVTAIWGEFMYHDVSHTPQMAGFLGQRLKCCGVTFQSFHPECYPIKIPENDTAYSDLGNQTQP